MAFRPEVNLRVDWREAHKWWSTWALLLHILGGLFASWGVFQDILPWWVYVGGSIGLSVSVWALSHITQRSLQDECAPDSKEGR